MFWKKKNKKSTKIMSCKEAAMSVKAAANLVFQDFSKIISPIELVMLNALISYMDTFILKCFKDGRLKHTTWILARLIEVRVILSSSTSSEILTIVDMISSLEHLIYAEKVRNG